MGRRNKGRDVSGIILIDKPLGDSSNHLLQKVKRLFNAKKAGHTGALDPLATGMLPLCLGEATKFSQYLLDSDKTYQTTAKLGIRTTTSDADGEVVSTKPVALSEETIRSAVAGFKGKSKQMPSMYSALKYQGQPLYKYAREGIEVPRKIRDIEVFSIEILDIREDEIDMEIHCSKGTYIRTIVDDLGEILGCGAHVSMLRRTAVAHYPTEKMMTFDELVLIFEQLKEKHGITSEDEEPDLTAVYQVLDAMLLPVDSAVINIPVVKLGEFHSKLFSNGQTVECKPTELEGDAPMVRVKSEDKELFLGMGSLVESNRVKPVRIVNLTS